MIMTNFSLNPFLKSIKHDIPVCVRDYERIALALQTGGEWTVERLKDVLLTLLVKNRDQQRKFLRRFDAFFPADIQTVQTVLSDREINQVIKNIKILIHSPKLPDPRDTSYTSDSQYQEEQDKNAETHKVKFTPSLKAGIILVCLVLIFCVFFGIQYFVTEPEPDELPTIIPTIIIEPKSINFGVLKQEESINQPPALPSAITITNIGPGTAIISKLQIIGTNPDHFKTDKISLPAYLPENQQLELKLIYAPHSKSIHNALLNIESNAENSPVRISLKGQFIAKPNSDSQPAKRLYKNMPYVEKVEYYDLPEKPKNWIYFVCAALLFLLFTILYTLHLIRSRKIPEDEPADFDPEKNRRFSLAVALGKPSPVLSKELLDHLADCMGYFKSEEASKKIDIKDSVKETVKNCGIPEIVFNKRRQGRKLLVLEDNFARSSVWNTIADELIKGMKKRGVPVIHGRYDRSPDKFKAQDGRVYHLEDLEDQRHGFLVLIFAEVQEKRTHNFAHETVTDFTFERLGRWPMKAWLDYKAESTQNEFTTHLQKLNIPVFPASSKGLYEAVKKFISEQGSGQDLAPDNFARPPAQIPERADAHVEFLLKDALPWAQDCAMIQPIPLVLADALRKHFHPHLPPERASRLFELPDTINTNEGLRFSTEVQTILRKGFTQRRTDEEQKGVLHFIADEIRKKAEPKIEKGEKPGLNYLKWEAILERIKLELDPDNDLERFTELRKTQLGPSMQAELESYCFKEKEEPGKKDDFEKKDGKILLRIKPENKKALQRLAEMEGNPFDISRLKAFPIDIKQWFDLAFIILCFLYFSGLGLYGYSEWRKPVENLDIKTNDTVQYLVEREQQGKWIKEQSGTKRIIREINTESSIEEKSFKAQLLKLKDSQNNIKDKPVGLSLDLLREKLTNIVQDFEQFWYKLRSWYSEKPLSFNPLSENVKYRMILYENGYRTIKEFDTKSNKGTRIHIKEQDQTCNCKEEFTETGLTVLRCIRKQVSEYKRQEEGNTWIIETSTWKEKLGTKAPKNCVMSIGLEFLESADSDSKTKENPSLTALRQKLFETSSIDILYQLKPDKSGKWHLDELFETMQRDLSPRIQNSQLILWHKNNLTISTIEEKLPDFQRVLKFNLDKTINWQQAMAKLFEPAEDIVVSEKEILASLSNAEVLGQGAELVTLIRPGHLLKTWTEPITGMEFVWIPSGCFQMGSDSKEAGSGEKPVHEVCVDGFWMAKTEVTNKQYRKYKPDHNSRDYDGVDLNKDEQPVVYVSWEDAKAFAKWLGNQSGQEFSLPTEAQWEYAARAGTNTARFWGDSPDEACSYANVADLTAKKKWSGWAIHNCNDGYAGTAPVGSFQTNKFGLYDMLGNVWEWCEDVYDGNAYSKRKYSEPVNNPLITAGGTGRVLRGGSWDDAPTDVRSANRNWNTADDRGGSVGFRLCAP